MRPHFLRRVSLLVLAGASLGCTTGCEWIDHNVRPRGDETRVDEPPPTDTINEVRSDPEVSRSFFKSSRLSGAMSSEGRDIERSLGIP